MSEPSNCRPHSALLTDLYEITMAAAYFENGFSEKASFELFVRSLPKERGYLIAAGLEQALCYLENLRFQDDDIEYLQRRSVFRNVSPEFFEYLRNFRFTGEVWAVPEGTPVFGEEPLLRITAPMIEAQVVETFLISTLTFQTMIASKAARVATAAQGRAVVEFGSRRAHGPDAGVLGARAAYLGGCVGTSNLEAGKCFGIPVFGTLAHSFVMAYDDEEEAFRRFSEIFPERTVLLVDTYDTLAAIDKIIRNGLRPDSVRLDSGDLLMLSKQVRQRLDRGGLTETKIFASGDLDEFAIAELLEHGAPVDAFGVGTALATSKDAPALSGVYKLVDLESDAGISYRAKFSQEKITYPGRKQVYRFSDAQGIYRGDIIACESEALEGGEPLLQCVMRDGKRIQAPADIRDLQKYALEQRTRIPAESTRLHDPQKYPVSFSTRLRALLRAVHEEMIAKA